MISGIYKIQNLINNKVYIGQSHNVNRRIGYYKRLECKEQPKLYRALLKYGIENFSIEVIDYCFNQEELNDYETYWINFYDTINSGYNIKEGGANGLHSQSTKNKMSISQKKRKFRHSEENKKRLSNRVKGLNNPQFKHGSYISRTCSKCSKIIICPNKNQKTCNKCYDKCGSNNPFNGKFHTDETKRKQSLIKIKKNYVVIDPNGIRIDVENLREFCRVHKLHSGAMYDVANGKYNHHKNYKVSIKEIV